ncbi:MAG: dihydrofolate reductase [Lachnospiraceae bacterium]|nr:dihydrofolate reductase [Lachnospiraceae bacterium]MDD4524416.1 dihydrofolate reductase [Lachnospiraceae bacterium]
MNIIVAADANWAIGNKGELLVSIPADHRMFRQETIEKVIVYGRKTLETFPMKHVLDGRENIILSTRADYFVSGAKIAHSIDELMKMLEKYDSDEVYVIGGAKVYSEMLPYVDVCHVTKIDQEFEADAFFPNLDRDPEWEITARSEEMSYFDTTYHFVKYERKNKTDASMSVCKKE